ncbi:hypothetical protein TWF106_010684 [Orbilia oligospora]|uniref:BZIP domain-containing protein n=1 Tax=Orbilia oligospora TaxID=2813651 RepID=A0A7C8UHS9_ORBOL|nr:hypothetical protein TWF106_010684 [Orbilia oligospora]
MTGRKSGENTDRPNGRSRTAYDTIERLERIRNNQRRSRARRKEYVGVLEQRLREYEASNNWDRTSSDEMLEYLLKENASLKRVLSSIGVSENLQRELAEALERVPTLTNIVQVAQRQGMGVIGAITTRIDQLSHSSTPGVTVRTGSTVNELDFQTRTPESTDVGIVHHSSVDGMEWGQKSSDLLRPPTKLSSYIDPVILQSHCHRVQETQSPQNSFFSTSVEPYGIGSFSGQASTATTTLCSVAYEMVLRYNHKAYTMEELDRRLRCGYLGGYLMDEGCSVDNKILFRILAEIC